MILLLALFVMGPAVGFVPSAMMVGTLCLAVLVCRKHLRRGVSLFALADMAAYPWFIFEWVRNERWLASSTGNEITWAIVLYALPWGVILSLLRPRPLPRWSIPASRIWVRKLLAAGALLSVHLSVHNEYFLYPGPGPFDPTGWLVSAALFLIYAPLYDVLVWGWAPPPHRPGLLLWLTQRPGVSNTQVIRLGSAQR